jgi:hypothetical protein
VVTFRLCSSAALVLAMICTTACCGAARRIAGPYEKAKPLCFAYVDSGEVLTYVYAGPDDTVRWRGLHGEILEVNLKQVDPDALPHGAERAMALEVVFLSQKRLHKLKLHPHEDGCYHAIYPDSQIYLGLCPQANLSMDVELRSGWPERTLFPSEPTIFERQDIGRCLGLADSPVTPDRRPGTTTSGEER